MELIEREREVALLAAAVARGGCVIVIEGPAGVGKSCLIEALTGMVTGASAIRAVELDASTPLAVARRLLEPALRSAPPEPRIVSALHALHGVRGSAAPLVEAGTAALCALVAGVEALVDCDGPLTLVVDDAHWADRGSLRLLVHLAERAPQLPIVVAVGVRRGELDPALAARLRSAPGAIIVEPPELTARGTAALVRQRVPAAGPDLAATCHCLTSGNPFLLTELLAALDPADPRRLEALAPRSVVDGVLVRLSRLEPSAADLARAAAVLGDGARLRDAAELAGVEREAAARLADALARVDILHPGHPLRFRHPLLASALYEATGAFTRGRLHRQAADRLVAEGELERAAAHLLRAPAAADARVISLLRAAADRAAGRGDAAAARRLLRRALEEPPAATDRARVLVDLARAEAAAGDPDAVTHLDEAVALLERPAAAAAVLRDLSRMHYARADFARAAHAARRALELAPADGRMLATWLISAALNPPAAPEHRSALEALLAAPEPDDPGLQAVIALVHASSFGDPALVARLACAAVDGELRANEDGLGHGLDFALSALSHVGALSELERTSTRVLTWAADRGSVVTASAAAVWRAHGRTRRGDLDGAAADTAIALVPSDHGWMINAPHAHGLRALIHTERDDRLGADAELAAGAALEPRTPTFEYLQGLVMLARGQADAALAALGLAGELLTKQHRVESPAVLPWRSAAAVAAARAGHAAQAAALAADELALARRTRVPTARALALRGYGLVHGDPQRVRRALNLLRRTEDRLETIRTQVELGAALRRTGARADARAELAAARDEAEQLGLDALAARAEQEQHASGARPRRARLTGVAALTPSERRIAERAAAGQSNRQIAAEFFLTIKTVEWHLNNVFHKLDINTRDDLEPVLRR